jgi:hypothetical protein
MMEEIIVKKFRVSRNMYVLCVPDKNKYFTFYVCHEKHPAVLTLFNGHAVRDPGGESLQLLAHEGWMDAKDQYWNLAAFVDELEAE